MKVRASFRIQDSENLDVVCYPKGICRNLKIV